MVLQLLQFLKKSFTGVGRVNCADTLKIKHDNFKLYISTPALKHI